VKQLPFRALPAEPWVEGDKIPWNEPAFSRRMLDQHLSQEHDWASRRFEVIDRQVAWLHDTVLGGRTGRVLDLGCGPGLYLERLARRGHTGVGIDFSPASIEYARGRAVPGLEYRQDDVRDASLGGPYDLITMLWAELNVFLPEQAGSIVKRAAASLAPGGLLVLELHRLAEIERQGRAGTEWYTAAEGLWSDHPHLCLTERFWDETRRVATTRWIVVDTETSAATTHASSSQGYGDDEIVGLLAESGVRVVGQCGDLEGGPLTEDSPFLVLVAQAAR
jgi:2-polyprenyl-3-methyl-5-hydroxy-6-metoxy-1,4-benzoquinol methylase